MAMSPAGRDSRSGTIVVLVIFILAALTVLAATLVLSTRVERRTSEHHTTAEAMELAIASVELWCINDVLINDRYFGSDDGTFRFHDGRGAYSLSKNSLEEAQETELPRKYLLMPAAHIEDALDGDGWVDAGEVFDEEHEFVVRDENYAGGKKVRARFLLHLEDLGGARLDVNMTGNWIEDIEDDEGGGHVERHGITPLETRLESLLGSAGADNPEEAARRIVDARGYGNEPAHLEFPGATPPYPDYPAMSPEHPAENQYPFGPGDLLDCVLSGLFLEFTSPPDRLSDYVDAGFGSALGWGADGNPATLRHLTATSAAGIVADIVPDEAPGFRGADRLFQRLGADDLPSLREGDPPFTDGMQYLLLQRPLRQIMRDFSGDAEAGADAIRGLLDYIHASDAGFRIPGGTDSLTIARNIWNMLAWVHREDGHEYVSGGVVPGTPYVAELVAHRPLYLVIPPSPDARNPNTDALDRMKYIKMVNPWPEPVRSKAVDLLLNGDVIKSFEEGEIAPQSHFLLVAHRSPHHGLPDAHDVVRDLEKLSYGDTLSLQIAGTGQTIWETTAGCPFYFSNYWMVNNSVQIHDPRSRRPHNWSAFALPTPSMTYPIWQGVPIPTKTGVIWIWFWNWWISGWYWPVEETDHLKWFNSSWRGRGRVGSDGWYLLHSSNLDDMNMGLLGSFAVPHDSESGMRFHRSPADLTYVHSGFDWSTLSPYGADSPATPPGGDDPVFLAGLSRHLTGNSPFEHGADGDPIYPIGEGNEEYDRLGPPLRLHGRVNVNTAATEVLETVIPRNVLEEWGRVIGAEWTENEMRDIITQVAASIESERAGSGAFIHADDLFDRVPALFGSGVPGLEPMANWPGSHLRHAMARSMFNRVTVRSDVWGITGRIQLYETTDAATEVVSERAFYVVIDRSFPYPRVLLRTELPIIH